MAMLAEPRQRKRYNLTPRGKALYEDDTRFGTKMLEKMGWSKGKGLGANENGSQDFVRVRMRNTNEGLGYEDRDDHWTQHEQDFNGLLKSLNGDDGDNEKATENKESASDDDTPRVGFGFAPEPKKTKVEKLKDKISGVSLEQKSKLSKARVHYQKFTKGKDIAQYSEKDLANIFGKKVVETEQADGVYAQLTAIMTHKDNEKSEASDSEEKEVKQNFAGVQTISTGLSVSDYFKLKMEALKNKQKHNNNENENPNELAIEEIIEIQKEEPTQNKKKSKKRKHEREADETISQLTEGNVCTEVATNTVLEVQEKKEKQKKKNKNAENIVIENDTPLNENFTEAIDILAASKKKEKKEAGSTIETVDLTNEVDIEDYEAPKKKKKKKSKGNAKELHTNQNEVIEENKDDENVTSEAPKKKKKSKKSKREREQSQEDDDVICVSVEPPTYEKSLVVATKSESPAEVGSADDIKAKKNKKSKKEKNSANTPQANETEVSASNNVKLNKSKKDVSEDKEPLTIDELIAKCNSFNIYTISSFVAEKFRNVDLDSFKGSTITHIPGYTQTEECELKVQNEPNDEERITRLWNCSENKYVEVNPKAIYGRYKQNMLNAYINKKQTQKAFKMQAKKPLPLFNIKSLKRKSVFQPI